MRVYPPIERVNSWLFLNVPSTQTIQVRIPLKSTYIFWKIVKVCTHILLDIRLNIDRLLTVRTKGLIFEGGGGELMINPCFQMRMVFCFQKVKNIIWIWSNYELPGTMAVAVATRIETNIERFKIFLFNDLAFGQLEPNLPEYLGIYVNLCGSWLLIVYIKH